MTKKYDFYNLSENIKATAAVLSHLSMRAVCYSGDYTKAGIVAQLIEGLLANIKSLIEAAKPVQDVSRSITADILTASAQLKHRMFQYKDDLGSCLNGSEDDIGIRRPSNVYERTIPNLIDISDKYYNIINDLRFRVEAESLMQPAGGKAGETKEQSWEDNASDYIKASDAIVTFTQSKMPQPTLSKMLRQKDNTIRWMRKGQRCKVHIGDFRTWAEKEYPPDSVRGKIADEVLEHREKQQENYRKFSKLLPTDNQDNQ